MQSLWTKAESFLYIWLPVQPAPYRTEVCISSLKEMRQQSDHLVWPDLPKKPMQVNVYFFTQNYSLYLSFKGQVAHMDSRQLVCQMAAVFRVGRKNSWGSVFESSYLTLAQLDLLGSSKTGASSLDRLVTIPRIMFSMRVKISMLEIKVRMSVKIMNYTAASQVTKRQQRVVTAWNVQTGRGNSFKYGLAKHSFLILLFLWGLRF